MERSPQQIIDEVTARFDDHVQSRRRVLAGTATGIGALAAFPGMAMADDEHEGQDGDDSAGGQAEPFFEDDVAILNYARTLEFLEARFYRRGLENIDQSEFYESPPISHFGEAIRNRIPGALRKIQRHEEQHVQVLGQTITDLGGEPVPEPQFDFGTAVQDPQEFLATAALLEDTGVGAYAGAAPSIQNAELVPPALSIHSVEARHASFLRTLTHEVPFPNAFDPALAPEEVLQRASQFIASETQKSGGSGDEPQGSDGAGHEGDGGGQGDGEDHHQDDDKSGNGNH